MVPPEYIVFAIEFTKNKVEFPFVPEEPPFPTVIPKRAPAMKSLKLSYTAVL
jgi:hypothetical protein